MTNYPHIKQAQALAPELRKSTKKKTKNTAIDGTPSTEEMNAVLVLYNEGRNVAVETLARSLTARFPQHGFGWKVLGTVLHIQDQVDEALLCMHKAARFLPGDAVGHNNLGMTLKDQGRFTESETSLRRALAINPEYAQAHNNLGVTLKSQGRLTESETSLRQALAIKPDYAEAHSNLGITLNDQGRLADAEISLRQALALNPNLAESHNNLGNTLRNQGRLVEAESSLRQALVLRPNFVAARSNLGHTLQNQGRPNEAIDMYRQALALNPDYAEAHNNLGVTLYNQGKLAESEMSLRQALVLKPDFVDALNNLGNTLKSQDRLTEAETSLRRALVLRPESAGAHSNLGSTLHNQSRPDEAIKSYRQAMAIKADFAIAHDNLLFCLSHDVFVDAQQLYAEHLTFGEKFEAPLRAGWQPHNNTKDPERCLQVGFVSGDLCNHALANFLEPVFEFLAKKQTLSIHAYYTHTQEDEVTQRLRNHFAHWHAVASVGDVDLANQIRADGIDILIDLSGHTAKNRLLSFIHKPAPIQVSWLGYLGTTGLQAMDYYLCDKFWIPPSELDWQFTEKPAFLPSAVIFKPSAHAPPVNRLPALANGYITLGSFNRPNKLNASVIALWSMLLRNIPNARMVLGAIPLDSQDGLIQSFAHEGIEGSRLVFFPRSNLPDYLALHHQVDFCLDTFPYGGGATTAHAAWMGVPTLCLAGETPASRFGATEMHHLGLDKFIGTSIEDFVNKGCYWAEHIAELATLRTNMRARFMASPLGQPQLFANNFEALFRTMWQRWCSDLPVEAIANSDLKVIHPGESISHAEEAKKLLPINIGVVSATATDICLEKAPSDEEMNTLLALYIEGKIFEVETIARSLTARFPRHGFGWKVLGTVLHIQDQVDEALLCMQKAAIFLPGDAVGHNNLGMTLKDQGRFTESETSLRQALAINPEYAQAHNNLGVTLKCQGRFIESETSLRQALALKPDYAEAHSNLGGVLDDQGRFTEAKTSLHQALTLKPNLAETHNSLLFCLSHDVFVDAQQLYAEHLTFGEKFEAPLRAGWQPHNNTKDPERCLQVGFVSGDLCNHALANFLEPVFEFLAKKQTLSIHAYYTHTQEDEVTQRLRNHFAHWHAVASVGDVDLANQIRADGIDILIDLSGHTAKNRLLSFIHKPAPIQVSWLGYLGTTGLQAMDYYLCDKFWIPPGELDWQFTEKPAYLPTAMVFQPNELAPPVNTLPAIANGFITFGSFNRPNKLNASVIALWSMLLRDIPNARMVLGAIPLDSQDGLIQSFAHEDIEESRLVFYPRSNTLDYLALHHQVDFCLDTFPYGGGATTAHAAWMGVPTLCLAGETPASRFGATLMHHLDLDGFVATSIEDFVNKGLYWAEHTQMLAVIRSGMRGRFEASPVSQPEVFANNFETMLRSMWDRWCNNLQPAEIEIAPSRNVPENHAVHFKLACSLHEQGRLHEAEKSYTQALKIQPSNAVTYCNLGNLLILLGHFPEAEAHCRHAIALKPDLANAHNHLGYALHAQGKFRRAQASYREALALKPNWAEAYNNLAITLKDEGHWNEAKACYRTALAINPDWAVAHSNLLFCLSHDVFVDAQQLYAEHLAFGEQFESPLRAGWLAHPNVKNPARCLHVGFVSGDFHDHALANFLEPVFEFLAQKQTLSIHAYYTHTLEDEVTQRLRNHFAHWHAVASVGDVDLANQIRADGIDILIDLSGHTAKNRLLTFIHKPAPIQVSWLGYLGTTGLQAMDYYLCDKFWIPPGELDWQFTEKPAYLPTAMVFQPNELAPPVNTLPAIANGFITFGSFNRPNKLNASVIALWSMLLRDIPNARMVLGAIPLDSQDGLIQSFAHEGIDTNRLVFFPRSNLPDYLALHHQVDFCLDTFPYGGGATTAHAAWMGVPTLCLAGETPASRFGATLMRHLGLDEFVCTSIEDFVGKGVYWTEHIEALAQLRTDMRARFNASDLGQPERFADNLDAALRSMWQRWCEDSVPNTLSSDMQQPNLVDSTDICHEGQTTPLFDENSLLRGDVQPYKTAAIQQEQDIEIVIPTLIKMALDNEQLGQLLEASHLYLEILKIKPKHDQVNHNLGLLEAQLKGPSEALPRLKTAVQENPSCEKYWVSYIYGLMQSGAVDTAASALELGQKYSLRSEIAEAMANDFVAALERMVENKSANKQTKNDICEDLLPPPSWPSPKLSLTANLDYIRQPGGISRRYVIYSPLYRHNSAGIRVLYELQKWLICAGLDAIIIAATNSYQANQFIDDIAIYPEVVFGNPLKAKRVVRYILNVPGKLSGDKEYAKNELLIAYNQELTCYSNGKILQVPSTESFFYNDGAAKTVNAVYVGKGQDLQLHPDDCIYITGTFPATRREVAQLLRSVKTLYLYDNFTMICHEAMLCGCAVQLISKDGSIGDSLETHVPSIQEFKAQLHDFIEITKLM